MFRLDAAVNFRAGCGAGKATACNGPAQIATSQFVLGIVLWIDSQQASHADQVVFLHMQTLPTLIMHMITRLAPTAH